MATNLHSGQSSLALVTGASSGIGLAFAERLAANGYDLIVVARRTERLHALKDRLESMHGGTVDVLAVDLATEDGVHAVEAVAAERVIDLLVDNAALAHYMPFVALPPDKAAELVKVNVMAPVRLIRAVLPGMVERRSGTVISIASQLAFSATSDNPQLPQRAVYAASKAFLLTFIRVLAMELKGTDVRVQVVCPGLVNTEFHSRQGLDMSQRPSLAPEQVVAASLRGLELGEIVCLPSVEDTDLLARRDEADLSLLAGGLRPALAERYQPGV